MGRNVWISDTKDRKIGREGRKINTLFAWLVTILQRAVLKVSFERKKGARNSRPGWGGDVKGLHSYSPSHQKLRHQQLKPCLSVQRNTTRGTQELRCWQVSQLLLYVPLLEQKRLTQRGIHPYSCKLKSQKTIKLHTTLVDVIYINYFVWFSDLCGPFSQKQNNVFLQEPLSFSTNNSRTND